MMQGPTFGSFGDSVDDAVRTEFFSWFSLVEEGRATCADGSVSVRYKPEGNDYRPFTTCRISIRAEGPMDCMALEVHGAFVDSAEVWRYARDITGSFIRGGLVNQSDTDQVQEILLPATSWGKAGADKLGRNPGRDIPRGARDYKARGQECAWRSPACRLARFRGFAVYTGDREAFIRDLSATRFSMRNLNADGQRIFVISFERTHRADGAGRLDHPPSLGA